MSREMIINRMLDEVWFEFWCENYMCLEVLPPNEVLVAKRLEITTQWLAENESTLLK